MTEIRKNIISVITVCYNAKSNLEKTILSVLNQTYSNIEYIIIDGGSTDGTIDIIKRYDDKITYWQSEPDNGIYDAMNKGIQKANGEWINFMNAGDLFASTMILQQMLDAIKPGVRILRIVIAIGNDNEGMALAIDLYEYAYRYRKDCFNDFRIYLRVNGSCNTIQLKQIKEYFNIYGNTRDVIITFGAQEEIFSYDVVSTDVLEVLAKEFYYAYQKIMIDAMPETNEKEIEEKKKAKESLKQTAEEEWNARREALQDKHSLNAQIKLAYQEEQDRANVWHIDTKKFLAGAMGEDGKDNKERLKEMVELTQRDAHTLNYSKVCDVVSSTLFDNLSKCEHLRWNACMELQGFVTCDGDKDFQQKKHKCIVDNDILRSKYPETIPYDQCVVELSFRLKKN